MPSTEYETRKDSVLAWKKNQKLGRFDPNAPDLEEQKVKALEREVEERGMYPLSHRNSPKQACERLVLICLCSTGITTGARCHLLPSHDDRRGTIAYVGLIPQIPGLGPWIGIALDEPTGKNDGSVAGTRYFECPNKCGVFVRPERVEVGDYPVLDDLGEEMEEM